MLGPATHGRRARPPVTTTQIEAELGGNHDLSAERSKRFADQFFVGERPINFGGVEKRDAALYGRV
jgi:hypothetical protein